MTAILLFPLVAGLMQPLGQIQRGELSRPTGEVAAPRLEARLYAAHQSIPAGGQTELAIVLKIPDGWHIYHPIIVGTGAPTTVSFEAPPGVSFGELRYPTPRLRQQAGIEYLALEEESVVLTTCLLYTSPSPRDS